MQGSAIPRGGLLGGRGGEARGRDACDEAVQYGPMEARGDARAEPSGRVAVCAATHPLGAEPGGGGRAAWDSRQGWEQAQIPRCVVHSRRVVYTHISAAWRGASCGEAELTLRWVLLRLNFPLGRMCLLLWSSGRQPPTVPTLACPLNISSSTLRSRRSAGMKREAKNECTKDATRYPYIHRGRAAAFRAGPSSIAQTGGPATTRPAALQPTAAAAPQKRRPSASIPPTNVPLRPYHLSGMCVCGCTSTYTASSGDSSVNGSGFVYTYGRRLSRGLGTSS